MIEVSADGGIGECIFEFKQITCMDLDHTSSKGGVEYSACFQQSLASWYGRSMRVF